jgi:hypothetical protein
MVDLRALISASAVIWSASPAGPARRFRLRVFGSAAAGRAASGAPDSTMTAFTPRCVGRWQ